MSRKLDRSGSLISSFDFEACFYKPSVFRNVKDILQWFICENLAFGELKAYITEGKKIYIYTLMITLYPTHRFLSFNFEADSAKGIGRYLPFFKEMISIFDRNTRHLKMNICQNDWFVNNLFHMVSSHLRKRSYITFKIIMEVWLNIFRTVLLLEKCFFFFFFSSNEVFDIRLRAQM